MTVSSLVRWHSPFHPMLQGSTQYNLTPVLGLDLAMSSVRSLAPQAPLWVQVLFGYRPFRIPSFFLSWVPCLSSSFSCFFSCPSNFLVSFPFLPLFLISILFVSLLFCLSPFLCFSCFGSYRGSLPVFGSVSFTFPA